MLFCVIRGEGTFFAVTPRAILPVIQVLLLEQMYAAIYKQKNIFLSMFVRYYLYTVRTITIIFGALFTLLSIGITAIIVGLVGLVGAGKDFWSVWIVQLDAVCILAALACWIVLVRDINKKSRDQKIS